MKGELGGENKNREQEVTTGSRKGKRRSIKKG